MTNVQKLEAWIKDQKENHGLIDIKLDTVYHGNLFADCAVKLGVSEDQVSHFRVPVKENKEKIIEDMAGEILALINAPIIDDKNVF